MTELPRHSVSVAGIVFNEDGQILVVKRRDNGEWQPPGGVLELNETIEDGLRREILEETGLEVAVGPITGVYKNIKLGVIAIVAKCMKPVGELRTGDETVEIRWIRPTEASELVPPTFAIRITDALGRTHGATQRTHDGSELI